MWSSMITLSSLSFIINTIIILIFIIVLISEKKKKIIFIKIVKDVIFFMNPIEGNENLSHREEEIIYLSFSLSLSLFKKPKAKLKTIIKCLAGIEKMCHLVGRSAHITTTTTILSRSTICQTTMIVILNRNQNTIYSIRSFYVRYFFFSVKINHLSSVSHLLKQSCFHLDQRSILIKIC